MSELIQKSFENWSMLVGFAGFIIAQIISYNRLKWHVDGLLKSINNVGSKVRDIEKKIDQNEIEQLLRVSDIKSDISKIEGILEGIYKPRPTNGRA